MYRTKLAQTAHEAIVSYIRNEIDSVQVIRAIKALDNESLCELSKNGHSHLLDIDKIAFEQWRTILRTPPYHPELQPIETCWAVVKWHVAAKNDFKMETVWHLLDEDFNKVSTTTIEGIINKVKKQEDSFWKEDSVHDNFVSSLHD